MNQNDLFTYDDEKLIWVFVEPIIRKVRGKDPRIKAQVYMTLKDGQRALFMFQVLYGHAANGISQFFLHVSYIAERLDIWSALKSAMNYFGDIEMLGFVEKIQTSYSTLSSYNMNTPLRNELDELYNEILPRTLKRISACIKNNPAEFSDTEISS